MQLIHRYRKTTWNFAINSNRNPKRTHIQLFVYLFGEIRCKAFPPNDELFRHNKTWPVISEHCSTVTFYQWGGEPVSIRCIGGKKRYRRFYVIWTQLVKSMLVRRLRNERLQFRLRWLWMQLSMLIWKKWANDKSALFNECFNGLRQFGGLRCT